MVFWHLSGFPNGCPPTGHFPQWKRLLMCASEEEAYRFIPTCSGRGCLTRMIMLLMLMMMLVMKLMLNNFSTMMMMVMMML
eukprot:9489849-Pyramimonas_sp.AAC.1